MRVRVACGMLILALAALPAVAQPVATESLSATGLSIAPQIGFERAVLRISGPDGYQGKKRFEAGASIQVDLTTFSRRSSRQGTQGFPPGEVVAEATNLPEGRYKYEVVFWAEGKKAGVHTGTFFVEGGLAVSREAKQIQLSDMRSDLVRQGHSQEFAASFQAREGSSALERTGERLTPEGYTADYFSIFDTGNDGYTFLTLDSDLPSSFSYWSMINNAGDLEFHDGDSPLFGTDGPKVTFERGSGRVGIGTTAPGRPLHVVSPSFTQLQLTAGYSGYDAYVAVGAAGLWIYNDSNAPIASFNQAADAFTLVVDAEGVGVGDFSSYPYYPTTDLHVKDTDPQLLIESTGAAAGRTLAYMKNSGDVRMFWENTASGDIWQMSLLSTVLQMASPTGVGKFRVRKNGGLQALTGSTEIMALNSTGDLTVKSVTETSSRDAKNGFETVDGLSVLEKVAGLPISEWSYKADSPSVRHIGPMSEDFHAAFGLGKTDKGLTSVDTSGVALAAIQGLNQKLVEKDARIDELELRLQELEQMVQDLAQN